MALSNDLSRTLDWMFSWGGLEGQAVCKSVRGFACPRGKLSSAHESQGGFMGHVQGPSCPCLAVEPSVSLQTKPARCYKLYYCVADKTNNQVDGITFGHMLHFFKYFFVLCFLIVPTPLTFSSHWNQYPLLPSWSQGWKVQTGTVSHPAKQGPPCLPPSMTQVSHQAVDHQKTCCVQFFQSQLGHSSSNQRKPSLLGDHVPTRVAS